MVNTILTDDEIIDVIRKAGLRVIGPHKILARAVEAAVLAKLAKQEPFGYLWPTGMHPEFRYTQQKRGGVEGTPLYTHPAPQQADRQRVPDGYVLVSKDRLKALSASINGDCYMGEEWEKEAVAAMLAAAPEAPAQFDWSKFPGYLIDHYEGETLTEELLQQAAAELAAPEAPAQASAVDDDYKGWYCAHCRRGVDAREVTFHEQHEACGRVITEDRPPKTQASAVDERDRKDAERYRWLRKQHWTENLIGVVIRPKDNARLGSMLPSLELLDDTIDHMKARAALAQKGD